MNSFEIIRTVRLTEKGTRQGEKYNQYTLMADPRANKTQIRTAVQELFKVKVVKVNTLNVRGKFRRQRTKQAGQSAQLEEGHRHPESGRQDRPHLADPPADARFISRSPGNQVSRTAADQVQDAGHDR